MLTPDRPRLEQSNVRVVAVPWKQTPAQAVHLTLCPARSKQARAAETSGAGSRRNLAVDPSYSTGVRHREAVFIHLRLPAVGCSWILPLRLHSQEPKDDPGTRCLQAESLAVPALPFYFFFFFPHPPLLLQTCSINCLR